MDLTSMSMTELRRMQGKIETEIKRRSTSARRDLLKKMEKMAADAGLSLSEVVGAKEVLAPATPRAKAAPKAKSSRAGVKVAVKYRHPENADLAWTGRGRKPKWVEEWLAAGNSLDQIAL